MRRVLTILVAVATGWVVYMVAMMMTVYDGLPSMIFQPIMAVICSALTVGVGLVVGLLLKIPVLGRWWRATPITAAIFIVASLLVLCFGSTLGLSHTFTNPKTQEPIEGLRPDAALFGYFVLLFAIANWPLRQKGDAESGLAPDSGPSRCSAVQESSQRRHRELERCADSDGTVQKGNT
jgi:hypothetical protein